jgi:site-specific recombinase XerD
MSTRNYPDPEDIDLVEWYLQERKLDEDIDSRSLDAYRRELDRLRQFLEENYDLRLHRATNKHAKVYRAHLQDRPELGENRINTVIDYLSAFYSYMEERDIFETNIFKSVRRDDNSKLHRPEIDLEEMRELVSSIQHPLRRAIVVTFLKTGMRNGELTNLDLQDVHLDHPKIQSTYNITHRTEIRNKPDSIYIANKREISSGDVVNTERREEGNKRTTAAIIPIDTELKQALIAWLNVRPNTSSPALFTMTSGGDDNWGERPSRHMINHYVRTDVEQWGWHTGGHDASQNVTPHYFRHFFTTHLRHRIPDTTLKYLRGDSLSSETLDKYTQLWGVEIKEPYLDNIYKLYW